MKAPWERLGALGSSPAGFADLEIGAPRAAGFADLEIGAPSAAGFADLEIGAPDAAIIHRPRAAELT